MSRLMAHTHHVALGIRRAGERVAPAWVGSGDTASYPSSPPHTNLC
jgi:hypothetical protein